MTLPLLITATLLLAATHGQPVLPFLSPMFGSHMVLQRGKPNRIWGWTSAGSHVKVIVAGRSFEAVADPSGKWVAKIDPPKVGGPYTVKIEGPTTVELDDVMVGDVWICSGQSNMEFGLTLAKNGHEEVAAANHPNIRLYIASRQIGYSPKPVNSGEWKVCSPETVAQNGWGGFSAVGYFFGRELEEKLKVPIGLVSISWGGTSGEAWTSEDGLREMGDFNPQLDKIDSLRASGAQEVGTYTEQWIADNDPGNNGWQSADLDDSSWSSASVPDGFTGVGMNHEAGAVWFRKEISLPDPLPAGEAVLNLGLIHNIDTTFVNGQFVGEITDAFWARHYALPAGVLKPGKNVVAIRAYGGNGFRGFASPPEELTLQLGDGSKIPLAGEWKAKVAFRSSSIAIRPRDEEPNPTIPAMLNNGMIAPAAPLAIRGAIWYQGETNGGRGYQYRRLLPALIADWRRMFGQGDFPFYIVSLANWMQRHSKPGDDGWAELREAQAMTAEHVPHSGLAIAIDIGDAADIHPKDKQTVGRRLALNALALEYGQRIPYSGPVYRSMAREGGAIRLRFLHTDEGLAVHGDKLEGFAIAGDDHKWHWADARIDGKDVVVSSADVSAPVAVRYAWQANPAATLYNRAGLPAVPFRTDDWPGVSVNNK